MMGLAGMAGMVGMVGMVDMAGMVLLDSEAFLQKPGICSPLLYPLTRQFGKARFI